MSDQSCLLYPQTEIDVMQSIIKFRGKKTIIIVAHRLSTIKNCDLIIEMSKGKIINIGKPKKILRK